MEKSTHLFVCACLIVAVSVMNYVVIGALQDMDFLISITNKLNYLIEKKNEITQKVFTMFSN